MLPKVHNASLFRCSHCEVFFKSKKGYEGHLQNKHGPKVVGSDGKPKSRKEMQGLNKVCNSVPRFFACTVFLEIPVIKLLLA